MEITKNVITNKEYRLNNRFIYFVTLGNMKIRDIHVKSLYVSVNEVHTEERQGY